MLLLARHQRLPGWCVQ